MAVTTLGAKSVGSTVTIQENTGPMSYYVSANNYNAGISTNPSGYRLVVRSIPFKVNTITFSNGWKWDEVSAYQNCLSFYENTLTDSVKAGIPEISYYAPNANKSQQHSRDNYTYGLFSTKVFALNYWHINNLPIYPRYQDTDIEPTTYQTNQTSMPSNLGSIATTILQNFYPSNGSSTGWIYLPNMYKNVTNNRPSGTIGTQGYVTSWSRDSANKGLLFTRTTVENPGVDYYILIGFCLPDETKVNDDGTLYQGPLPPSGFVNFPSIAMQQNTVQISWAESNGATSYTLQRSTNSGSSWETVYTGPNTSYTDTIGTWDTVMYQVSASNADGSSPYTQSASIPVVASSTLVISGQDGELGALTGDVSFQVLSNTGNQIDLSVSINGFTFYTAQVDSGYNHKISIYDIPTGSGQIVASASVQSSAGQVNQTKTWQYIKQSLQFVDNAGMSVLEQNGENIYPMTVQEAVKTYSFWGNTLDKAMMQLANATFYSESQRPIYSEYNLDMSKVQVGDIVQLPENGIMQQFLVCSTNYEPTLNTSGNRVLLTRKQFVMDAPSNPYQNGEYWSTSDVYNYLNTTYLNKFDEDVKSAIGTTNYLAGTTAAGNSDIVGTVSSSVFLLSLAETNNNYTIQNSNLYTASDGTALPIEAINTIWDLYFTGNPYTTLTRSFTALYRYEMAATLNGQVQRNYQTIQKNVIGFAITFPCFTLPATFSKTYYVDINNQVHDAQEYVEGNTLTNIFNTPLPFTKYASGTYTGTGTSGSSNPMSLTFPTKPLFVMISDTSGTSTSYWALFNCNNLTTSYKSYSVFTLYNGSARSQYIDAMLNGNTLGWYATGASYQMNDRDSNYVWIAFLE